MWAMSRPGLLRSLPGTSPALIVETLIDRECAVYCEDADLVQIASRVGAHLVTPEAADHLFLSQAPEPSMLASIAMGSDMYPDDGATLVVPVKIGAGPQLRLTGPGVNGEVTIAVEGIPAAFWAERARTMRYPMGFELFLVEGNQVLGLPRSTKVEVL
jgi:alpha-D-ribose 1-methylphosphonate 5-triphosphate synthase subunit PhnH